MPDKEGNGDKYVTWKDLDEVLDRHGDRVYNQMKPDLDRIYDELGRGRNRFDELEEANDELKDDVKVLKDERHAKERECEKVQQALLEMVEENRKEVHRNRKRILRVAKNRVDKSKVSSTGDEYVNEEGIKKKTAIILAIIAGSIAGVAALVIGIIYIASLLPW